MKSRYGIRAMVDLALYYSPNEPIPLVQIADRQGISEGYLEQVMNYLRKGGLVRSVRGAQGGFMLARKPDQITAGEIIRCLEGPLSPTGCVSEQDPEDCEKSENCVTRMMWEKVRTAVSDVLDNTTLEDFRREADRIQQSAGAVMYNI